jgi:uncharacterized protein (DUF1330 family)
MKHNFVVQIKIHDPKKYERYLKKFDDIFSGFKGKYLAINESHAISEGKWDYTKSGLIKFNNKSLKIQEGEL